MKKKLVLVLTFVLAISLTFALTSCDMFDDDDDYVVTEQQNQTQNDQSQEQNNPQITEEQAADIALAKVEGATKDDIYSLNLDIDDGRSVYEGKIFYNGLEYEFEIDAITGDIIEWDMDRD